MSLWIANWISVVSKSLGNVSKMLWMSTLRKLANIQESASCCLICIFSFPEWDAASGQAGSAPAKYIQFKWKGFPEEHNIFVLKHVVLYTKLKKIKCSFLHVFQLRSKFKGEYSDTYSYFSFCINLSLLMGACPIENRKSFEWACLGLHSCSNSLLWLNRRSLFSCFVEASKRRTSRLV